ncbi:N-acetylmuramoyl-L-alanine amidase [Nitrospina gracilis]|uniref:N-acetylmuramoyl-L-alanine amidase n=1 Tax=Nitrospina gracilis TaxID=35801 RepID=UPI001F0158FE|nr:N-acetylmuramoyl-L-alanine amidase [Nitrospina gracilis]MCF8720320.1 N-acetylmuramoyl-L-alanine amidase [Nitrospina gracilis Nb-211]
MTRQTFVIGRLGRVLQIAAVACLLSGFLPGSALAKPSAASPAHSLYDNAKKAYYQLLENAKRVPNRDDWVSVIRLFEKVLITYPQTELAYKATFTVGRLYQKLGKKLDLESDLREAGRYYSILLKEYPEGHLNDDSLFQLADIDLHLKDYQGARERLQNLLKQYPDGDKVEASRTELKRLVRLITNAPTPNPAPISVVEAQSKDHLTPQKPQNLETTPKTVEPVEKNKHVPLVVVDAGHGGKDHGAIGHHGLKEKEVNLNISKQVAAILTHRYKLRVVLTRDDDRFIELADRGKIANQKDADLFVSIHANAAPHKAAEGIETYYLGSGATEQARETASRENGTLIYSVADDEVQQILASLISTTKINDSSRLASKVQRTLHGSMVKHYQDVHDLGVKEGPFFVLHDTNMPSILVEVGFVTNRREEKRLSSQAYQKALAEAIAKGIYEFLKEKAPSI